MVIWRSLERQCWSGASSGGRRETLVEGLATLGSVLSCTIRPPAFAVGAHERMQIK
jgi:hypothetical protein